METSSLLIYILEGLFVSCAIFINICFVVIFARATRSINQAKREPILRPIKIEWL